MASFPDRTEAHPRPVPTRWVCALVLVLAAGFLLGLRPLSDNNIDFHLHGGQWILQHLAVPATDTYTYAARGRPYIDLHWLFQVAVYGAYRLGGFIGLSILNAAMATLLLALLALRLRRLGAGPASSCWVLLAAAIAMHQRFLMRPENVTFLFLALVGLVLDRHLTALSAVETSGVGLCGQGSRAAPRPARLWVIPLIHLFWVNTQGLFVLGWVVTATCLVSVRLKSRRWDRPLAVTLAASVLVSLANPYFVHGVIFPLKLLTRFDRANVFAQHVGEFQGLLSVAPLFEDKVLFAFAILLFVALAAAWKRMDPHEIMLPPLFFALALAAVRNVPLFVVVAAPILGKALTQAAAIFAPARVPARGALAVLAARVRFGPVGAILCCVFAIGLVLRLLTGAFHELPGGGALYRLGVGLDHDVRPVAAGRFLLEKGLDGAILNSSHFGGWLGWVLPQPVYLDMRLEVIGENLFREEVDSWNAGGLARLISKYRPQLIVYANHGGARGWTPQLRELPEWRLIFVDEAAVVYAREGYAPSLPAVDLNGLPGKLRVETIDDESAGALLRQRVPGRARRWLEGFFWRSGGESPWRSLGRFCASQEAYEPAERLYLASLAAGPGSNRAVYGDLGSLYALTGRPERALLAYDRYLEYEPGASWAVNERGIVRAQLGDLAGAIDDFTRAIEGEPRSAAAYRNRGLARHAARDLRGAREDYSRALVIDPADEQVRGELAAIDAALAQEPEAGKR